MPDDLPVGGSHTSLSPGGWWPRQLRIWESVLALAYLLGTAMTWLSGDVGIVARIVASGLLLALAVWWRGLGRRLVLAGDDTSWRGVAFLAGVLALFAPAAMLVPESAWILFGLCPLPYMVRANWVALAWVGTYNAVSPLSTLLHPHSASQVWGNLAIAVGATAFSHLMGLTIARIVIQSEERATLIKELEASRALVATLSREAGVTAERERLAAEIHDTLAQGFASILTLIHAARCTLRVDVDRADRHLDLAAETARENLAEARALVGALTPVALDTGSLTEALRKQARQVAEECGIAVAFHTEGELGQLSTPVQVVLLRAAQEGLANVRKHSGARSSSVRLLRREDRVRLEVADDGTGFDPSMPVSGFGLRGMRARAEQVGGSVRVDSGPGGTMVLVEVPA